MEVLNKLQHVPISQLLSFYLGPLQDKHPFLFSDLAPIHLLGCDFLVNSNTAIFFSFKGEIALEFESNTQENSSPFAFSWYCANQGSLNFGLIPTVKSGSLTLWAKSSTDVGRIHSAPYIKIQIDPSKPFSRINQYSINKAYRAHSLF